MPGRKPKLTKTTSKHFTKEELEERLEREKMLAEFKKLDVDDIPSYLSAAAKKEWKRIVPLLEQLPIANLDLAMVAMYCNYYALFVETSKRVKKEGVVITTEGSQGQPVTKQNENFRAMLQISKEIKSIASSLGLSLDSRMRIIAQSKDDKEEVSDPFAELMSDD
ncbi:phage terminase small subunit P27 family [Bacillus sp. FSL W8-0223]|uniref:phage terminase small subunit P27 family n=1 Tax=Bacillus sp. FSL W8-0223 TaxID=2954595 RepID=UPI0030F74FE6